MAIRIHVIMADMSARTFATNANVRMVSVVHIVTGMKNPEVTSCCAVPHNEVGISLICLDANCGGVIDLNGEERFITSPGYPTTVFEKDQQCSWLIKV